MKYQLRPYQKSAVKSLYDMYHKYFYLLLVSPTGSGKTVIASKIIESAVDIGNKVMFLAHRRELVNQCSNKLDEIGVPHGIIMSNHPRNRPNEPVQIASIQTLINRSIEFKPNFIIIDEAHRSLAESYLKIINLYPQIPVLGLTATPWRGDGKGLNMLYENLHVVAQVQELVDEGFLIAPTVFVPYEPDLSGLKIVGGDYVEKELNLIMNKDKLVNNIVNSWMSMAATKPTLVFASSISHSKHIVDEFNRRGVPAEHIDYTLGTDERDAVLAKLRAGKTKVISNMAVLTEGWDFPELECVILARPTKSLALYLQMVGRGMRPFEGKEETLVIDHAGCTAEHGLATQDRDYNLEGTKNNPVIPGICPNCNKATNGYGVCDNCQCVARTDLIHYDTTKNIDKQLGPRCAKCGSMRIARCRFNIDLQFTDVHQCQECEWITFLRKFNSYNATSIEMLEEHYRLLAIQKDYEYHDEWAKFRYYEIFNQWPRKPKAASSVI